MGSSKDNITDSFKYIVHRYIEDPTELSEYLKNRVRKFEKDYPQVFEYICDRYNSCVERGFKIKTEQPLICVNSGCRRSIRWMLDLDQEVLDAILEAFEPNELSARCEFCVLYSKSGESSLILPIWPYKPPVWGFTGMKEWFKELKAGNVNARPEGWAYEKPRYNH